MPKPNTTELSTTEVKQPTLRAVPMGLFPTMGNLNEVVELAKAKFPVEQHNDVLSLLFTYHNTLLSELK
jgi:hypothetical protein